MALVFKVTLLALVALTTAAPSLSARDQKLADITGAKDVAGIQQAFQKVFQSSDIDQVLKKISSVTKQKDPVSFLAWTLEITAQKNLEASSQMFLKSTTQNMSFMQYLETVAANLPHDLKDFYVQIVKQTAKSTIQEAFGVLVQYLGLNDLFEMVQNVMKYTKHPDPVEIHETLMKATVSSTLQDTYDKLMKSTNTKNALDAYAAIQAASGEDVVDAIQVVGTIKADSWEEKVALLQKSTNTSDFLSALKANASQ